MPRTVTAATIGTALHLDGKLDTQALTDYLDRVLPPGCTDEPT